MPILSTNAQQTIAHCLIISILTYLIEYNLRMFLDLTLVITSKYLHVLIDMYSIILIYCL